MYQEKGTIYPKRGRERPILKTHHTTAIDLLSFRLPKSRPCNTLDSFQPRVQSKRDGQFSRDNIFFSVAIHGRDLWGTFLDQDLILSRLKSTEQYQSKKNKQQCLRKKTHESFFIEFLNNLLICSYKLKLLG